MANETKTVNFVRDSFRNHGYYDDPSIFIDEQISEKPQIQKLLQNASKKGSGRGKPEFIIGFDKVRDLLCVVECKADVNKHQSKSLNKYADYAVDGVKLYSDYLSKEFDVLSIAVSGELEGQMQISHFLQLKGEKNFEQVFDNSILDADSYISAYQEIRFREDYDSLLMYVNQLNETLHAKKIPENERAVLFSGILIALEDDTFLNTYARYSEPRRLANYLVESIIQKLKDSNIQDSRIEDMKQAFNFIKYHTALIEERYLFGLIDEIYKKVRTFIKSNKYFDILSQAYIEFLKYANNDRSLGIVLTPPHIAGLFCDLAKVTKDSVVIDNCCGTGSFLVEAMKSMVQDAKGDKKKIDNIKKKQLIGIEYQPHIFTLCCSNMIIHGDGKTNIIKGDCFEKIADAEKYKPDTGFLNPPYKSKKSEIEELKFVLNNANALQKGGVCISIFPTSCVLAAKGENLVLKEEILKKHTLEAVLSVPDELFYPVGAITVVMVLKAHQPHPKGYKTYFGYWKEDGFIKKRIRGRIDFHNKWATIKKKWLDSYLNREVEAGFSVLHAVDAKDEWCAEAYMQTSYSKSLTKECFEETLKKYQTYKFFNEIVNTVNNKPYFSKQLELRNLKTWQEFTLKSLFSIRKGGDSMIDETGKLPQVSATRDNNGISKYVAESGKIFDRNTITVASNGNSTGESFYQEINFCATGDVNILTPNFSLNVYIALFITTLLRLEKYRFNYGRKWGKTRMESSTIYLPVDNKGNPDWEFMEEYIKSLPYSSNLESTNKDEPVADKGIFDTLVKRASQPAEQHHQR